MDRLNIFMVDIFSLGFPDLACFFLVALRHLLYFYSVSTFDSSSGRSFLFLFNGV